MFAFVLPAIILIHFWLLKNRLCPFCGEGIPKCAQACCHCGNEVPRGKTADEKIVRVGREYGRGARIIASGGSYLERKGREMGKD
jgi:hypothetical protein